MSNPSDIDETVAQMMADFVQQSSGWSDAIEADMSLINEGLIDSLSLVNVVVALQTEFSIEIGVAEITVDNFDTIAAISQFVKSKLN